MGRGESIRSSANIMFGKSQDIQNAPVPYMPRKILISPPLNNQCHIADFLRIPTNIRFSQNIVSFSGVVTAMLQPMKQTAAEGRMQWVVMQLCQRRIIHRAILWNRMMRIRCWIITISLLNMFVHNFSNPEEVVNFLTREKNSKPDNTRLQT